MAPCGTLIAKTHVTQLIDSDLDASEVLLASQSGPSRAQFLDVPERRLLVAVLVDAVRILLDGDERERAGVLRWIQGVDARIPFGELCLNLELDPETTAKKLIRSAGSLRGNARRISTRRVRCVRRRSGTHYRQRDVAASTETVVCLASVESATPDAA